MEQRPNVAVLSGFGINCETETMAVFEMCRHINEVILLFLSVFGSLSPFRSQ